MGKSCSHHGGEHHGLQRCERSLQPDGAEQHYHAVFLDAVACDPKLPDACTEWRPISVASVGNSGNAADAKITGLCFTVGVGYVTPQQAARLDAIIARYQSAGCTVGACPGLSSMMDRCMQNQAGKFSCGGF